MDTLLRPPRHSRDQARDKARGPRRFHEAAPANFAGEPPEDDGGAIWPRPDRPSGSDTHLQWPFWLVMLVPWLMWGLGLILEHMKVCLICVPYSVAIP